MQGQESTLKGKRVLLLMPEAFGFAGGIQMFCRALCMAAGRWAQRHQASVSAIVLNDRVEPEPRYMEGGFSSYVHTGGSKAGFIKTYIREILARRPDLIVAGHVSLSPLTLFPAALTSKVRSCVITYGEEVWRAQPLLERKALARAHSILAISDDTKAELLKHNDLQPDRIRLFPCSLDPFWRAEDGVFATAGSAQAGRPPMLLTVCRLGKTDAYKGVDSVIRSIPRVVEEFGAVDYRVVGKGDDIPRLQALAAELGVAPYVTFTGPLSEEELREHYRRCALFVMPSEKEGFGIVFLEAMAYGKPVIGGAHGGTPSVVNHEETGLLVRRLDIEQLAGAILRLLHDEGLRERFGRAGRERLLREFTFQKFEENLDAVFRAALGSYELRTRSGGQPATRNVPGV